MRRIKTARTGTAIRGIRESTENRKEKEENNLYEGALPCSLTFSTFLSFIVNLRVKRIAPIISKIKYSCTVIRGIRESTEDRAQRTDSKAYNF